MKNMFNYIAAKFDLIKVCLVNTSEGKLNINKSTVGVKQFDEIQIINYT